MHPLISVRGSKARVVHGQMQGFLTADGIYEPTVPKTAMMYTKQNGKEIPDVCSFQPRNHVEDEGFRCHAGAVDSMHDGQWQSMLLLVLMNMSCTRDSSRLFSVRDKRQMKIFTT